MDCIKYLGVNYMRDSIKSRVINYFNSLLGECGYLLTTDYCYQYYSYAETEDELILDVYEELPEEYWSTRHHIPKNKIIGHFKKHDDLQKLIDFVKRKGLAGCEKKRKKSNNI